MEARNYAELHQRQAEAPGSVLLTDAGPARCEPTGAWTGAGAGIVGTVQ